MDILEHTRALREERMNLVNQAKAIFDEAVANKRGLSAEETAQVTILDQRAGEIYAQVEAMDQQARREAESAVSREAFERVHGTEGAKRAVQTEADLLRAFMRGEVRHLDIPVQQAAEEKRMIRSGASAQDVAEYRALAWDTGSVASAVPVTTARSLYEYMESSVAAFRMPTTKFNTASGEQMKFPKLAAHAIATQVSGQGTTLAGTDPTFSSMTLDAFKYGELVKVASEVIDDAGVDIVGFITRDVGRALGRKIDADLIAGSGSGQPNGVMTAVTGAGTIATGGSLIDPTYEKLIDVQYSVADEYRNGGSAAWLMNDLTAGVLRKMRDGAGGTTGAVLWEPSLTAGIQGGQPDRLLGHPVYTDPNVASLASNAKVVAFGDFSAYYVRTVGPVRLERDDSVYFATDESAIRGKWRVDGDLIDTAAINIIKRSV